MRAKIHLVAFCIVLRCIVFVCFYSVRFFITLCIFVLAEKKIIWKKKRLKGRLAASPIYKHNSCFLFLFNFQLFNIVDIGNSSTTAFSCLFSKLFWMCFFPYFRVIKPLCFLGFNSWWWRRGTTRGDREEHSQEKGDTASNNKRRHGTRLRIDMFCGANHFGDSHQTTTSMQWLVMSLLLLHIFLDFTGELRQSCSISCQKIMIAIIIVNL